MLFSRSSMNWCHVITTGPCFCQAHNSCLRLKKRALHGPIVGCFLSVCSGVYIWVSVGLTLYITPSFAETTGWGADRWLAEKNNPGVPLFKATSWCVGLSFLSCCRRDIIRQEKLHQLGRSNAVDQFVCFKVATQSSTLGVTSFQSRKQATGNEPTIYLDSHKVGVEWGFSGTVDHFMNHRLGVHFFKRIAINEKMDAIFFPLSEGNECSPIVNSGPYLLLGFFLD